MNTRHVFVTGATGLIGRWLVPALTARGCKVTALVRNATERESEYRAWIEAHGGNAALVRLLEGDLSRRGLGLGAEAHATLADVDLVYHLGAAMELGLEPARAKAVNEDGTERVARMTAALPKKPRLVLITGFRVAAAERGDLDRKGAYEATKIRADRRSRELAQELGFDLTVVNPALVIGDSRTGETTQLFGFPELVRDIGAGRLPFVPGGKRHWLPLVTVDYLASFLAVVPFDDRAPLAEYFLLDDETPPLGEVFAIIADALGVRAPRFHVPMPLAALAMRLAGQGNKVEGLTFVSTDRYETTSAREAARFARLERPDLAAAIRRNVAFIARSETRAPAA